MKIPVKKFLLEYGYRHCIGRTVYEAGTADTEEQAQDWVAARSASRSDAPGLPMDDPIRWCPVRHCHMKHHKPWIAYSEKIYDDS